MSSGSSHITGGDLNVNSALVRRSTPSFHQPFPRSLNVPGHKASCSGKAQRAGVGGTGTEQETKKVSARSSTARCRQGD